MFGVVNFHEPLAGVTIKRMQQFETALNQRIRSITGVSANMRRYLFDYEFMCFCEFLLITSVQIIAFGREPNGCNFPWVFKQCGRTRSLVLRNTNEVFPSS